MPVGQYFCAYILIKGDRTFIAILSTLGKYLMKKQLLFLCIIRLLIAVIAEQELKNHCLPELMSVNTDAN
jgi:hypothetical protein